MGHPDSKLAKLLLTMTALALLVVLLPGTSPSSVAGPIMRPDWSPMHGGPGHHLNAVWGSSDNNVFAVGALGTILHYNGQNWRAMNSGTKNPLVDVWGSSGSDVFAVGMSTFGMVGSMLHYSGVGLRWTQMDSYPSDSTDAVWGSSSNDVFALSGGTIYHYDGLTWSVFYRSTSVSSMHSLHGIWGRSGSSVFSVGGAQRLDGHGDWVPFAAILHYDGSTWTTMESSTKNTLRDVWGSSDNNVFAVGDAGTILYYDGSEWSTVTSGIAPDLHAVWGSSESNVFAVGDAGTILRYDGSTWSRMSVTSTRTGSSSRNMDPLYGIWGSSENDVFAVGSETIMHHPGHFTAISPGVNWGLVGRIIAAVVLVVTVFGLMVVIDRRRGKTVKDK
ncbi:MAG: hypothetical protein JW753_05550 [Dehalococcoidia bacterium]|nr:hypothetical protein [Dehalococcoidia bacterium]